MDDSKYKNKYKNHFTFLEKSVNKSSIFFFCNYNTFLAIER